MGKTNYYVIRVEFQVRGSRHIHSFICNANSPTLTLYTVDSYIEWLDKMISAELPNVEEELELFELVKTYQLHRHSKTCRRYKNESCRFLFGRFFTEKTIIGKPLAGTLPEEVRKNILAWRDSILKKVTIFIDEELNPAKRNFYDKTRDDYFEPKTIGHILTDLNIEKVDYGYGLSISDDQDFQVHLKQPPNSCFFNNYFRCGLLAWEANMDIQPVFNHYKAVSYMCAYLSKTEDECSQAMSEAVKESLEANFSNYEQMHSIAQAYSSKRECSLQEAVYHIMPELWLRKIFQAVVFANTNLPENRYRVCLSEAELKELPEDSPDIFKKNMLDRYMSRPDVSFASGKCAIVDQMCFAEFLRYYSLRNCRYNSDSQPIE